MAVASRWTGCPVIYLDAIVCKVRDSGMVRNKHAYVAVGVDVAGRKQVLGITQLPLTRSRPLGSQLSFIRG